MNRQRSTAAARRGDAAGLPAGQFQDGALSLPERHARILENGMQPFAGGWKERLQAELTEPALVNLILATSEQKRQKLLGSQDATKADGPTVLPPGYLPLPEATAVFDEIIALYGVAIAHRVSESQVPVPAVPTSVLKQWRQQYGVPPVSPSVQRQSAFMNVHMHKSHCARLVLAGFARLTL